MREPSGLSPLHSSSQRPPRFLKGCRSPHHSLTPFRSQERARCSRTLFLKITHDVSLATTREGRSFTAARRALSLRTIHHTDPDVRRDRKEDMQVNGSKSWSPPPPFSLFVHPPIPPQHLSPLTLLGLLYYHCTTTNASKKHDPSSTRRRRDGEEGQKTIRGERAQAKHSKTEPELSLPCVNRPPQKQARRKFSAQISEQQGL